MPADRAGAVLGGLQHPLAALMGHGAALVTAALLLLAAGQPLLTEDTWWHLSLGEAYAAKGPWLTTDPTLHTATGPPAPAAWLFDLLLYGVERTFGFQGLRVAHVLLVAGILSLAWGLARRAGGSPLFASLALALFVALAAYRLFQLRPHLATLLATLLLLRLLLTTRAPPSWRAVATAALLLGLWANLHGGFVLGLVLLGAAVAGLVPGFLLGRADTDRERRRLARLACALGLGALATLVNPTGPEPHLLYFSAGAETPSLEVVADEWARPRLLALPLANVPPSPLAWAALWGLLLATPLAAVAQARRRQLDPALLAVAAVSLVAMLSAVRLSWLGVVPLLLVARSVGPLERRAAFSWAGGLAALCVCLAFVRWGDWPMISRGIARATWAEPYVTSKLDSHAVWLLRDAGLEGNLYNDYASGNYLGYWLAPRMRVFVNGSLNVPTAVMQAQAAIQAHAPATDAELTEQLDRYPIDVFFGAGLPVLASTERSRPSTTTHLESAPGWIPLFRSVRSGLYLRSNPRNRANLERITDWYASQGVPFDPLVGFDPKAAIRGAPRWALEHGLLPVDFFPLEQDAVSFDPSRRRPAQDRLARALALLGVYGRAAAVDLRRLQRDPDAIPAARRRIWSLLHAGQVEESLAAADRLHALAPAEDGLSRLLVAAARRHAELPEVERSGLVTRLPLLHPVEARFVLATYVAAEPRPAP